MCGKLWKWHCTWTVYRAYSSKNLSKSIGFPIWSGSTFTVEEQSSPKVNYVHRVSNLGWRCNHSVTPWCRHDVVRSQVSIQILYRLLLHLHRLSEVSYYGFNVVPFSFAGPSTSVRYPGIKAIYPGIWLCGFDIDCLLYTLHYQHMQLSSDEGTSSHLPMTLNQVCPLHTSMLSNLWTKLQ